MLLLRLILGGTMSAHGGQKLFGWWEGPGPGGTAGITARLRFRQPRLMGLLLGLTEFGAGLFFAAGLLTPFAAASIVAVMLSAITLVHWKNGFFASNGGYEFNLLLIAGALTTAAVGPLRFSLDHALGWDDSLSGLWWGVAALGAGATGAVLALTVGRTGSEQPG
jgi:putative oxidoreductase